MPEHIQGVKIHSVMKLLCFLGRKLFYLWSNIHVNTLICENSDIKLSQHLGQGNVFDKQIKLLYYILLGYIVVREFMWAKESYNIPAVT
jgi:hypothetical protein